MENIIVTCFGKAYKVHVSDSLLTIEDSYRVKDPKDMKRILERIRSRATGKTILDKRSIDSMIKEWKCHNLLYTFGLFKSRTKSVDLQAEQPWYVKLGYSLLSIFYFMAK